MMPKQKRKGAPMCETSKTLLEESLKGSWYAQDQYTSNKSEAEIKFPETTSSKKIKLSEIDNENIFRFEG